MLAQALDVRRRPEDAGAAVGHFADVLAVAVDAAQERRDFFLERFIAVGAAEFAQAVKFAVGHAAAGTTRFVAAATLVIGIGHLAEKIVIDDIQISEIRKISLFLGTGRTQVQVRAPPVLDLDDMDNSLSFLTGIT